MRALLFLMTLSLLALLHLGLTTRAHACSCATLSPAEAAGRAVAVLEGRVSNVERQGDTLTVRLRVTRAWKGVTTEEVTVRTPVAQAQCGVPFEPNTYWLVYAEDQEGSLRTSRCERTRRADDAQADFAALGAGVTPVDPLGDAPITEEDPPTSPPARGGCASCSTADSDAFWTLALLLVWAGRTSGRREVES